MEVWNLLGKEKIEKEYKEGIKIIEEMVQKAIKQIEEKTSIVKAEANKVGEDVEKSVEADEKKLVRKKT